MKIVWITANLFGYKLLTKIIKDLKIETLFILHEDSKTKMYDSIDKQNWVLLSQFYNINLIETMNINNEIKKLQEIAPDYIIVAGWRQILSNEILQIPKYGVIGFHPTPLPKGRGPAPIINQILLGWNKSASTMFFYNDDIDGGDIIFQENYDIDPMDYAMDIYNKYIESSFKLLYFSLPFLKEGSLPRNKQKEVPMDYFPSRTLKDNEITMFDSLEEIDRKVRAFSEPYLGAYIKKDNKKLIIERCRFEEV